MNQLSIQKKKELTTKKKKGFTLIELIIVIAIIAVLAAIAIPKFGQVKKDANFRADQANGKIIATAVASAVSDGKTTPDDKAVYVKYIDGGVVPTPKSDGAKDFTAKYTDGNGTIVTMDTSPVTQVYPPTGSGSN